MRNALKNGFICYFWKTQDVHFKNSFMDETSAAVAATDNLK
jgi:hypothetical protein